MEGLLPNHASWGDILLGKDLVGRQFLILFAVLIASAQKGEGSLDLMIIGLAMSKRAQFKSSAVPFDEEE